MRQWIIEQWHTHFVTHRHNARLVGQQCAVDKTAHRIQPRFRRAVNEAAIDPSGHLIDLFARRIRTLAGVAVVGGTVEWNVLVTQTFGIVHFVAFLDFDAMHFDGASRLRRHDNFVGHHLAEKGQQCRSVGL